MDQSKRHLQRFYGFAAAWSFNPTRGLWILYLLHCHWTLFEVGLSEAAFHLVAFLAEVPTGVIADRLGRRLSLLVGLLIHAATTLMLLYLVPVSVTLGIVSVALGALSYAFVGGADQALLYDLVERAHGKEAYQRVYSRILAFELAVQALSTAVGGWLAVTAGWSWPFAIAALAALGGLSALRSLPEPDRRLGVPGQGMAGELRQALNLSRGVPGLRLWIVLGAMLGALVTINNLYAQSTLVLKGAPVSWATTVVATAGLVTALGSFLGGQEGKEKQLSWGSAFLGLFTALFGTMPLTGGSAAYLVAAGLDGYVDPAYQAALNHAAPESFRAAVLSLPSALFSLLMILLFPIAGWAMGEGHLRAVYLGLGLGLGVAAAGFRRARAIPRSGSVVGE